MGNVVSANLGQAPARQAAIGADIPYEVPCTTVNKVCASGMKAIMFGAQSIMLGHQDVIVAGGMESMSNIPYYVPKARFGYKYGGGELVDGLEKDGLYEVYNRFAMGNCAEHTAREMHITREEQDQYAIASYQRAATATQQGYFQSEIVPVSVPQRKGDSVLVDQDEEYQKVNFDKIPTLRPVFSKEGTVTAANASTINRWRLRPGAGQRNYGERIKTSPLSPRSGGLPMPLRIPYGSLPLRRWLSPRQ